MVFSIEKYLVRLVCIILGLIFGMLTTIYLTGTFIWLQTQKLERYKSFCEKYGKNRRVLEKDFKIFESNLKKYRKKKLPRDIEYLKTTIKICYWE